MLKSPGGKLWRRIEVKMQVEDGIMGNRVIAFLDFLYSMGLGGVIEAKLKVIGKNK